MESCEDLFQGFFLEWNIELLNGFWIENWYDTYIPETPSGLLDWLQGAREETKASQVFFQ
jgi:hypothetical protein